MGILLDIFDEQRQHLSQQIGKDSDPEKVARRIRNFLDSLPREYEKRQAPTLNEKRRLGFITDLLKETSSLLAVHNAELHRPHRRVARPAGQGSFVLKRLAQLVLLILLFGGLLATGAFSALLLVLLLAAVTLPIRLIGQPDKWLPYLLSETNKEDSKDDKESYAQPVVHVKTDDLLVNLRRMIRAAETVLKDEDYDPPLPPDNPLHEARDLLGFFQGLLEASQFQNAEYALAKLEGMEEMLAELDIQVEDFKKGQNDHHFEFQSSKVSRTQKFALVSREGRLLLRGTVLAPSEEQ